MTRSDVGGSVPWVDDRHVDGTAAVDAAAIDELRASVGEQLISPDDTGTTRRDGSGTA